MGETDTNLKKNVEALLFAAGRTVLQEEIEKILEVKTPGLVKEIVNELKAEYDSRDSPILLIEEGEGWKLTVKEGYLAVVQKINPHTELSKAVMETLAVVAWKQPITQAQVVEIRTNKAYDHVKELVELGFISKEKYGRSFLLKPTQKFLDYFDLPDQEAAKKLFKDFKDEDLQKKITQVKKTGVDEGEPEEGDHLGDLQVYDAGAEEDVYADRDALAAEGRKAGKLGELDVYEEKPGEMKEEKKEEKPAEEKKEKKDEEDTEDTEQHEAEPAAEELSEEEKAKKMAQELLEEDEPKPEKDTESEEEIAKVNLHPELEEYLKEGTEEKDEEPEEKAEEKKEDAEEEPAAEEQPEEGEEQPEEDEETGEEEKVEEAPAEQAEESEEPPEESKASTEEDKEYEEKRKALEEEEMKKEAGATERSAEEQPEESENSEEEPAP
ncbi:SMC-Scp complex subunit ScpB [Thermoproteota archaeon]